MRLFNRHIKIDNQTFYLTIDKFTYYSICDINGKDYYVYCCILYKERSLFNLIKIKKKVFKYSTYWSNYFQYKGDLDLVIDEMVNKYKVAIKEQKYISDKEHKFISKYE